MAAPDLRVVGELGVAGALGSAVLLLDRAVELVAV